MIREIDHTGHRVETGPVRIGNDWCGLFIRGDDCFGAAMYLRGLLPYLDAIKLQDRDEAFFLSIHTSALRSLIDMMESTNEQSHPRGDERA